MGLAERRVVKEFQEKEYENFLAEIKEVIGKDVDIDVNWDSLAEEGMSHLYEECWPQVYFQPLVKALESICSDDMGKEALNESLEKIVITNGGEVAYAGNWSSFDGNVLTLDHKPTTNVHNIDDRAKAVQTLLENSL